jgi:hypothetical protein
VRDTGMPASHYACQSPLNKIGLFLHVTCLRDGVPLGSPTPQLKNRMGLGGLNSAGFPQIFRPFKGIICGDISEFESSHPSHAVRSPPARLDYSTFLLWRGAAWRVPRPRRRCPI